VPSASSIANPSDAEPFTLNLNGAVQRHRFGDIRHAERMVRCQVRTGNVHTTSGGDFMLLVMETRAKELQNSGATQAQLNGIVLPPTKFVAGAPQGHYKFVTVEGMDFRVLALREGNNGALSLDVERDN
jgi:hypothetical protein